MSCARPRPKTDPAASLCTACAMCCDGTLFDDVRLEPADRPAALRKSGLALRRVAGGLGFTQPCAALVADRCTAYAQRPCYCREFECGLFRAVAEGRLSRDAVLPRIRRARRLADRMKQLLGELGDRGAGRALRSRVVAVSMRLGRQGAGLEDAIRFQELCQANHTLNRLLEDWFYPGEKAADAGRRTSRSGKDGGSVEPGGGR